MTRGRAVSPRQSIETIPKNYVTNIDSIQVRVKLNEWKYPRLLVVVLDCALKYMEGHYEVEDTKAQTYTVTFRNLEPGLCVPYAIVYWSEDGEKAKNQMKKGRDLHVMGLGPS